MPEDWILKAAAERRHTLSFLLLTPQQNYRSYIPVLAQIASLVRNDSMQEALLNAQTLQKLRLISSNLKWISLAERPRCRC